MLILFLIAIFLKFVSEWNVKIHEGGICEI